MEDSSGRVGEVVMISWTIYALVCSGVAITILGCSHQGSHQSVRSPNNRDSSTQMETKDSIVFDTTHQPEGIDRVVEVQYGTTVEGEALIAYQFGNGPNKTLVIGGIHGDEPLSAKLAERLRDHLINNTKLLDGCSVLVIPRANPDGLKRGSRKNANGVDLNRNLPASNWKPNATNPRYNPGAKPESEPEASSLRKLIETWGPIKIISIHCPLAVVNFDGDQSRALAETMAKANGYKVVASLGYETPGSLGSWAGNDLKIPIVTLELKVEPLENAWARHRHALEQAIRFVTDAPKDHN